MKRGVIWQSQPSDGYNQKMIGKATMPKFEAPGQMMPELNVQ